MVNFGYEYIVDVIECNEKYIHDLENIKNFVDDLIERVGMNKLGEIKYEYVNEEMANKAGQPDIVGYSVCQFIITSKKTVHFCNVSKKIYFNLFSCSYFDRAVVKLLLLKYFNGFIHSDQFITRF